MSDSARFHGIFDGVVADMFRLAERDHGLTVRRLAALSGIPAGTLSTWARGEHSMPAWAFWCLAQHIPNDLLTLCAEQSGKAVISATSNGCLDELGREAAGFTASYVNAKSDGVISHREGHALRNQARRLRCVAGAA